MFQQQPEHFISRSHSGWHYHGNASRCRVDVTSARNSVPVTAAQWYGAILPWYCAATQRSDGMEREREAWVRTCVYMCMWALSSLSLEREREFRSMVSFHHATLSTLALSQPFPPSPPWWYAIVSFPLILSSLWRSTCWVVKHSVRETNWSFRWLWRLSSVSITEDWALFVRRTFILHVLSWNKILLWPW